MKLRILCLASLLCQLAAAADQPNIVLFYADDLGYTDLSCQGSQYYQTPNIDRLATAGITFTNAYAAASNCAPSRASLMTGLHTPRHGIFTVANSDRGKSKHRKLIPIPNTRTLNPDLPTLAKTLQQAGYRTCVAGKWHLSKDPTQYGFDTNFGGTTWGTPKSYFSPYKNPYLKDGPKGEHLPARLANEVATWITAEARTPAPFFAYFPFYSVHTPIQARKDLEKKYAARKGDKNHHNPKYAAMIEAMDQAVGTILKTLDHLDIADNTLVIFTSDNGPHGAVSNAKPLRGSKGMYYEGGIREPFIVRWPGTVKADTRSHTPITQIDLFPTLATIAGAKPPAQLDGVDITPLLKGEPIPPRQLFWHFPAYLQSYQSNPDSRSRNFRTTPCGVIRDGDWKLIEYFEDGALELYHLKDDPSEVRNLAESQPERASGLHKQLKAWQATVKAPVPSKLNPNYDP